VAHVVRRANELAAGVVHGHGAKGGAYARLARNARGIRVYTPHGGSLHYRWSTPAGFLYLAAERALMARTDLFLFESHFGRDAFRAKVGDPGTRARVVHNGVGGAWSCPRARSRSPISCSKRRPQGVPWLQLPLAGSPRFSGPMLPT